MSNEKENKNLLDPNKEDETLKVKYSEAKTTIENKYIITNQDGTKVSGNKTITNEYKRWELEGKSEQILQKLNSLEKTPILQPKQQTLGENPETKTPEIIQESQIDKETFAQTEEKEKVLKPVEMSNLTNNNDNSGSKGSES